MIRSLAMIALARVLGASGTGVVIGTPHLSALGRHDIGAASR